MIRQLLQMTMFLALLAGFVLAVYALKHGSIAMGYASACLFASLMPMGFMHDALRHLERIEATIDNWSKVTLVMKNERDEAKQ